MTTSVYQPIFDDFRREREERLKQFQREVKINAGTQITGQMPNRNLEPLDFDYGGLFEGVLGLANGGTHTDMSLTGPGALFQATSGADITVGDVPFAFLDFSAVATVASQPLVSNGDGTAGFGTISLSNPDWRTGTLPASAGGTGVNNSTRTLTITSNGGTLAFTSASLALTIPASITALGRAVSLTATRIPFASDSNNLTDDANLSFNSSNGHTYFGGTPASDIARVGITNSDTDISNTTLGLFLEHTFSSASALTAAKRGLQFNVYLDGSGGGSGSGAALFCSVQNRQTAGTIADLTAISADARTTNAGNVTAGWGARIRPVLSGAGNIVTWRSVEARSPAISSTGAITTCTGVYIERQKIASGVTTGYGIFQADANDVNFFGGAIIMQEITAPGAPAANQGVLYLDDNGAGKTRLMIRFNTGAVQQIAIQP